MNKWKLLPGLAVRGIIQNRRVYCPYIITAVFSAFTFFVFSSILHNDLTKTLPHSAYAWMLLMIGQVLLGVILIPFLYYANSFLIKGRMREIGLYSILGLEKRHIGLMLVCETLILYVLATGGGIILGSVLSKLLFLLLLKVSGLPVEAEFVFTRQAFVETAVFFVAVFGMNLIYGLIRVEKSRPVELLSGSKKGEKEPRWTAFWGILGLLILGCGYATSIRSELDSSIFTDFFLAVFEVVIGTYLLFTSGSILLLKLFKRNRGFYYKPENFITVSGMLYRMKKNAAGLSNICIFSTMVIITLVCTITLYLGIDGITHFTAPYDIRADYLAGSLDNEAFRQEISALEEKYEIKALRVDSLDTMRFSCCKDGNKFVPKGSQSSFDDIYGVIVMTLENYNQTEKKSRELEEDRVLFYSSGEDFEYDSVEFMGMQVQIAEELREFFPWPKSETNDFGAEYVIIVKDEAERGKYLEAFLRENFPKESFSLENFSGENFLQGNISLENGTEGVKELWDEHKQSVGVFLEGEDKLKQDFIGELSVWLQSQNGFLEWNSGIETRDRERTMYGGLLFIGIIFGIVFFMCLLLIMYYKQVSEGVEDQGSFSIMRKVGMSDKEIKSTTHRQIFLVFFLPLFGALMHTCAGMFMVEALMGVLNLFNDRLIVGCCAGVALLFILIYGVSYVATAKTYYRIVR